MQNKSILLVDDEEIILNSIGMDLRQDQYNVTCAGSGEEAVHRLREHRYDLVITDLVMSKLDGIQVLKEAKKINTLTRVIILTGFGDMTSAVDALRLGADDYLLKPCEAEDLALRIQRCLEKGSLLDQLREQNEQLAVSEAQKDLLLNSTSEGIYGLDTQGRTTFINRAAEKMLGYTAAEIVGEKSHPLIHYTRIDGSSYPENECQMMVAMKSKKTVYATNELLWRKDGTSFSVDYSSTPIRYGWQVVGVVVVLTDTSEKKAREERKQQQENYLQQLQKFQSLSVMAGGIAHNFNNMLMAVIGNQELALMTMPVDQKEREFIEASFEAAKRAAKISTMMLQYVGQAKNSMQVLELSRLLQEMALILESQIPSQVELRNSKNENEVFVKIDHRMIQQVIINLVTNATEAIGEAKGHIDLEYGQDFFSEKELQYSHMQTTLPAGEYGYLRVKDDGPGMKKEVLRRVFEPFYTTKFTGRGMGLATAIGIMRCHQGAIDIKSKPGKGTTATLILPALVLKSIPDHKVPSAVLAAASFSGTVLVVDDEEILRELGQVIFSKMGFKVMLAADGFEALALFAKNIQNIDLVMLDIAMPRLDGFEVLRRIRAQSEIPVIMMTGYRKEEVAKQLADFTNVSLVQKPIELDQLKQKVGEVLGMMSGSEKTEE